MGISQPCQTESGSNLKHRKNAKGKCKANKSMAGDSLKFGPLPERETRTFINTSKSVDKTSLTFIPNDIPMETVKLHPTKH